MRLHAHAQVVARPFKARCTILHIVLLVNAGLGRGLGMMRISSHLKDDCASRMKAECKPICPLLPFPILEIHGEAGWGKELEDHGTAMTAVG